MLPPASKNVATGGPLGSYGKRSVCGSSVTPPRPPANAVPVSPPRPAAPPGAAAAGLSAAGAAAAPPPPAPAAPGAPAPCPRPRPRPSFGGPLFARIHRPEKSGLPSGVRGVGASILILPCASRGTVGSGIVGHWAEIAADAATTAPNATHIALFMNASARSPAAAGLGKFGSHLN